MIIISSESGWTWKRENSWVNQRKSPPRHFSSLSRLSAEHLEDFRFHLGAAALARSLIIILTSKSKSTKDDINNVHRLTTARAWLSRNRQREWKKINNLHCRHCAVTRRRQRKSSRFVWFTYPWQILKLHKETHPSWKFDFGFRWNNNKEVKKKTVNSSRKFPWKF